MPLSPYPNIKFNEDDFPDEASIERYMLQQGGQWLNPRGKMVGNGLEYHFKRYWELLWPDDSQTKWTDLILHEVLTNQFVALSGGASSWKSGTMARIALMDWSLFPDCTTVIVSSTQLEDLKARIFGEISKLWKNAKELYDWFPGHYIDHKIVITYENVEDDLARDMRNSIVGVACRTSTGRYVGLSKFSGRKNRRVWFVGDECFPAGTLVDTPDGSKPIETINAGDLILNPCGVDVVVASRCRKSKDLVKVKTQSGKVIICTPNHRFLTQDGWCSAIDLSRKQYMVTVYDSMQILWSTDKEQSVLQHVLLREILHYNPGGTGEVLYRGEGRKNLGGEISHAQTQTGACGKSKDQNAYGQSDVEREIPQEAIGHSQGYEMEAASSGRKWHGADDYGKDSARQPSGVGVRVCCENQGFGHLRSANSLQDRRGKTGLADSNRIGRELSQQSQKEEVRCEKNTIPDRDWVDSVEVLKQEDIERLGLSSEGVNVYNLQVANHPSYSVNGLVVHNCQFMAMSFLDAQDNLISNGPNLVPGIIRDPNSKEFGKPLRGYKGVFIGNPNPSQANNPLDLVSEPEKGWSSYADNGKTKVYDCRQVPGHPVKCRAINLDSLDSPNAAYPIDKPPWPHLCGPHTVAKYSEGHESYYSQGRGVFKFGLTIFKIITRELCDQHHAFDTAIQWKGESRTIKIGGLDAGYGGVGGDRCILQMAEFGECVDGKQRIYLHPQWEVPILGGTGSTPEDQIAAFCRDKMEAASVPPEHFYFDGRGSLAMSFARLWSPKVNSVEFGGRASERPVGNAFRFTEPNGHTRAKLCSEHYSKFVSELWWSWRYAIEADQIRGLTLDIVLDAQAREWEKVSGDRIEIETKREMKKRTGISPDKADALCCVVEGCRRRGFVIDKLDNEMNKGKRTPDILERDFINYHKWQDERRLVEANA